MSRPTVNDIITFAEEGTLRVQVGSKARLSMKPQSWPVVEAPAEVGQPKKEEAPPSYLFSSGYTLFGLVMALASLLTLPYGERICSACCPMPILSLVCQGLSLGGQRGTLLALLGWPVPLLCTLWSIPIYSIYAVLLAGVQAWGIGYQSLPLLVLLAGSLLACLAGPAYGLDAKWGCSVSLFLLLVLCIVSSLRVTFKIHL